MSNEPTNTTRTRNRASEIIVSGHVWKAVWYLAWPSAINTFIMSAYGIINGIFVGRLPNAEQALAAVGIGGAALMVQFALIFGVSVGASALIARFVGAQDLNEADEAAGQSLTLALLVGILSGLPLVLLARPICAGIGAQGPVIALAGDYTAIISWFSAPMFIYFVAQTALRGTGDMKSPLYAGAVTFGINAVFDYLLIFGIGPFPTLGVRGAAFATGISRIAGMVITLWFLRRSILRASFGHLRPKWPWFARILHIGWPAVLQNLVWTGANAAFLIILSILPGGQATAAQAAYNVALRIESLAFMPGLAFSFAATPLVGQNIGAGKPERAEHTAWVATGQAAMIMASVAVLFVVAPRWLALIFTSDKHVVPLIVSYLLINAVSEPFLAVGMVLRGALQGAGDTRTPMWISVLTLWVIRLPLAWFLARYVGYAASGAWIAMSASTILSGLLVAAWFKWGTWRTLRI